MKLTDMKLPKTKQKETVSPVVSKQEYPWGLTINLEDAALTKLGIKELPEVGVECTLRGTGKVTRVSQSASERDKGSRNVEIQLTKIALEHGESSENEKAFARGYSKTKNRSGY